MYGVYPVFMKTKANTEMTIGTLAKQAGVGVETVRFYERKGLITKPARGASTFRLYGPEQVSRIRFIKRAQELGFTLREAKAGTKRLTCGEVSGKAEAKIAEIEQKIADLKKMKSSLNDLVKACSEGKEAMSECRIMECFEPGMKCP
jgi:Hg(II)-responsive transcriptional regulator